MYNRNVHPTKLGFEARMSHRRRVTQAYKESDSRPKLAKANQATVELKDLRGEWTENNKVPLWRRVSCEALPGGYGVRIRVAAVLQPPLVGNVVVICCYSLSGNASLCGCGDLKRGARVLQCSCRAVLEGIRLLLDGARALIGGS